MGGNILLQAYEQLLEIHKRQFYVASKESYEQQIDQINDIELQKIEYISLINSERVTNENYELIEIEFKEKIMGLIEEITRLNNQILNIIKLKYEENSVIMKNVSSRRKTLQTYGGVNHSDIISYYFDEKK